jgi:hypothetical protein
MSYSMISGTEDRADVGQNDRVAGNVPLTQRDLVNARSLLHLGIAAKHDNRGPLGFRQVFGDTLRLRIFDSA